MKLDDKRFGLVTGSRCSPLVPIKSAEKGLDSLAFELATEMYFKYSDEVSTWQMEHGHYGEPFAFEHFKKYYDDSIELGRFINTGDEGGSTDAEANLYGLDFKCPTTLVDWLEYYTITESNLDRKYYNQCQMYMRLTGKKVWYICAYLIETLRMNDNGDVYPVSESKRMILVRVNFNQEWNDKFDKNLPTLVSKREEYFELIKSRYESELQSKLYEDKEKEFSKA